MHGRQELLVQIWGQGHSRWGSVAPETLLHGHGCKWDSLVTGLAPQGWRTRRTLTFSTLSRLSEGILSPRSTHPRSLVAICTSVIFQLTPEKRESGELMASWTGSRAPVSPRWISL